MRLGVVVAVLYCTQFSRELDDSEVERLAGMVLERPFYDLTVEEQYAGIQAALAAEVWDEDLSWQPHDETSVRDFLRRLLECLDARRPWQEPPMRALGFDRWEEYKHGVLLAHIRLFAPSQDRLHSRLRTVPRDADGLRGVVLRLRSGDEVAVMAPPLPDGYDAVLMTVSPHRSAAQVIDAFVTHVPYERDRVSPPARGWPWRRSTPLPPGVRPARG
ncbi:hypothetical protein ACQEWB_47775 [Streptomyces sp. CA-249302]|uniref:hypothetical protein n=1 Tax=Streptomyces sp. CA-249302 TaxID=3240058 RepID=UPI003D8C77F8